MNKLQAHQPMYISQSEAESVLNPYKPKLQRVIYDAWAEWERIPDEHRSKLNARARANCLYAFMVHYARVYFADEPEVTLLERRGLFLIGIANRITIRFKKLRHGKKTSNIMTHQQINFNLQLDLPGIPKAVRLTVGYILDVTQTRIKDVVVTLFQGRQLEWDFSINPQVATVVQMPINATQPPRKARVRAKKREDQTGE
jgi:hypothetical protein